MPASKPLVLDVDGTFLKTDLLFECFWGGLGRAPIATVKATVQNLGDRSRLKHALAEIGAPRVDLLPVHGDVAERARAHAAQGGEVVLASASDRSLVTALASEHGLSDRVFASDPGNNLKGAAKAAALVDAYGERGFDYAGNEKTDLNIWRKADAALIVGDVPGAKEELGADGHPVEQLQGGWSWRSLLRAMRPHQYVKNALLLLPMIAAHDFSLSTLLLVILGMAAFSAAASSIYIINDLLDLEADRLHPTKCRRPFASGALPIQVGMAAFVALVAIALGISALLGPAFLAVVAGYMLLSLTYSLKLKRMRWIDIFTLAALYTIRVVAGAAASRVDVSIYMLIFIYPIFLSLGCVKRLTELALATGDERLPGRAYGRGDRSDLLNMASLGIIGALVIWALYVTSPQGMTLYPTQWIMWLAMLPIALWLIRMVLLGYHGKQDYDPIVFAMRDRMGIGLLLITLSLMFWAAGLWADWFG